jgi:hypothetical protein
MLYKMGVRKYTNKGLVSGLYNTKENQYRIGITVGISGSYVVDYAS